ncbi:carbohydrate ABC transporter permease [Planomonospora parontospora]|uniref:carbohydrate ABC transporter permease n=1 Tax=Planomonospora parontospora TaxID=58119 RepID=UPI00360C057F
MTVLERPGRPSGAAGPAAGGATRRMRWWTPYAFLAPYLALFAVFMVLPIGFGFWTSLHEWDVNLPAKPFVGLENYTELFDPSSVDGGRFWLAMRATGIFTLFSVPLLIVLPLLVALLMNGRFRGRNLYRAVYFAPYVLGSQSSASSGGSCSTGTSAWSTTTSASTCSGPPTCRPPGSPWSA